jgi:TnpA family transposase
VRADTLAAANAALIAAQSRIELAQMWGGGLLASVDGLRFVVPVKSINTGPSPKALGAAFTAYGRIDKTMHLLALVDPMDDTYRRLMNRQLTVQESRHRLARAICHGGRGQIRQAYREGQEDQLAALGLVLNAVVLWNTRNLDTAVAQLRAEGHDIKDEDVARLSPLKDRHINFLGRYLFNIKASWPGQGLRPFRDQEVVDDED